MKLRKLPLWLIPMAYAAFSFTAGMVLPRYEHTYLASYTGNISVASAQAFFSAVASGMIALTGIVFAVGLVMVQFSAIAYSPRLVLLLVRDPVIFHSLGVFIATFFYSLAELMWVDREGAGNVPLISGFAVVGLLFVSMLLFARLVKNLIDLQIATVLNEIGNKGRETLRDMFRRIDAKGDYQLIPKREDKRKFGPPIQALKYFGGPLVIAKFDIRELVSLARKANAVIVLNYGVGDTLVDNTTMLHVHGAKIALPERSLIGAIHLKLERTYEQDPKYPIRLLVDIAIKALSPAINDPTTAVQAIDQIEDLLRRLGCRGLDAGYAYDSEGSLRVVFPMPTWEDYLSLAFDEIRQYGSTSVQVMRRLRSALSGLADSVVSEERIMAVRQYLDQLDSSIDRSVLDVIDREKARQEDRQGLGLSHQHLEANKQLP